MRVLIACEFSGAVRDSFANAGHIAISCDLLPCESPLGESGYVLTNGNITGAYDHYQGDVTEILDNNWDLMIAHPPCTYLTVTGNKWMKPEYADRFPDRPKQREEAIEFFMTLANAKIEKIAIENPIGIMSTHWRKPDQIIHPYQFGHNFSKATCYWLKNLQPLQPTEIVEPEWYEFKSGKRMSIEHFRLSKLPSEERSKQRSVTPAGIAKAMAEQWG